MNRLLHDLHYALRQLRRSPGTTTVAILSLALGIGVTTGVFSLFHQVLIRPLPVLEPDRLVNLVAPGPKTGRVSSGDAGGHDEVFSYAMFRDLQSADTLFSGIAAHRTIGANLAYGDRAASGEALLVSGSYFPVLGVRPALGRLLGEGDDRTVGESRVVVLSHEYWRAHLGGSRDVLNDTLSVNGQALTIVGVAPREFTGTTVGSRPDVYVPITLRWLMQPGESQDPDSRIDYWAYLFARLRPGVSLEQAQAAINVPYRAVLNEVEAPSLSGWSESALAQFRAKEIDLEPGLRGQSRIPGGVQMPLALLLGLSAVVLAIAAANVANLLLVRAVARRQEIAVRSALGAGRRRIMAQLLTESCLLAAVGGVAGLLVAHGTLRLIASLVPGGLAATVPARLDLSMFLFAAALAAGTGLLFGLFPALHGARSDLGSTLKGQAGQPAGGRTAVRFRSTLATSQIALSMTLLALAGLFTKSLLRVSRADLGLESDRLVTFRISPERNGYSPERSKLLFGRLEEELAALPGVTGAAASTVPLLSNWEESANVTVEGFEVGPDTDSNAMWSAIGPGFFRTVRIPLLAGREFTPPDREEAPKVAIVNQAFARKFGLGTEAVGKRMAWGEGSGIELDIEIVGLVQDAKFSAVKGGMPPQFFFPYRQQNQAGTVTFYLRTSGEAEPLFRAVSRTVATLDPHLPVENLQTMTDQVRENVYVDRFLTMLSAAFAALATLLAAIGLYGVLAYTVAQRSREIGLRMSLGATPGRVGAQVLRQVGWMTVVGGGIGLAVAVALGRVARSLLFEIEGHDPWAMATGAVLLALVAIGAGYLPARRAARVDPMEALRSE